MLVENFPLQVMMSSEPFDICKTHFVDLDEGIRNKPKKALWTSSFIAKPEYFLSDWERWCEAEYFGVRNYAVILIPKRNLEVLDITGYAEDPWYDELKERFPHFLVKSRYTENTYVNLNFNELRNKGYDGVHISDAHSEITSVSFYGWDCESTVWLHPNFYSAYRGGTIDEIYEWVDRQRTFLAKV